MKNLFLTLVWAVAALTVTSCRSTAPALDGARYQQSDGSDMVKFDGGRVFLILTEPFKAPPWREEKGFDFVIDGDQLLISLTSIEAGGELGNWELVFTQARDKITLRHKRSGAQRVFNLMPKAWLGFPGTKP